MSRPFLAVILGFFFLFGSVSAATDDFVADADIIVEDVTFGDTVVNMIIMNGSTAESFVFDVGTFTVTNPGTFRIGSDNLTVRTIRATRGSSEVACTVNITPGTTYLTLPASSGVYTISPSASNNCEAVDPEVETPGIASVSSSGSRNPLSALTNRERLILDIKIQLRSLILQLIQELKLELERLQKVQAEI